MKLSYMHMTDFCWERQTKTEKKTCSYIYRYTRYKNGIDCLINHVDEVIIACTWLVFVGKEKQKQKQETICFYKLEFWGRFMIS